MIAPTKIDRLAESMNELVVVLIAIAWLLVPLQHPGGEGARAKSIQINLTRSVDA